MKKLSIALAVLLAAVLLCAPVSASAPAAAVYDESGAVISPARWEEISSSSAALSITSAGKATSTVTVITYTSSSRITGTITLQKASGSTYTTYDSWPVSATGSLVDSDSQYVGKGTYRIKAEISIYSSAGSLIETTTFYSPAKTYS